MGNQEGTPESGRSEGEGRESEALGCRQKAVVQRGKERREGRLPQRMVRRRKCRLGLSHLRQSNPTAISRAISLKKEGMAGEGGEKRRQKDEEERGAKERRAASLPCHAISSSDRPRTSFHYSSAIFSSASSTVSKNTQTHTNRTAHAGSNLLHSQGCAAIMKRGI